MYSLNEESGDRQDSCDVSSKSLNTSRIAWKSLGRVWRPAGCLLCLLEKSGYQQGSCEFSWTIMGTSRIAVKSPGRVLIPAG